MKHVYHTAAAAEKKGRNHYGTKSCCYLYHGKRRCYKGRTLSRHRSCFRKQFYQSDPENFYDGLIFHRVIKGFMIQGGDPEGTGMGGPGYSIKGEFAQNGFENNLKHTEGVLSMARSMMPDSAGSQFFIMHKDAPHLDGSYAAFGKVIEGMDAVNKIAECKTDWNDRPREDQVMKTVTVETFGVDYPEPEKL